jgi:hypothetical protein
MVGRPCCRIYLPLGSVPHFSPGLTGSDAADTARPRQFFRGSQFGHAFVLAPSFHLLDLLLAAAGLLLPVSCSSFYDLCIGRSLLFIFVTTHAG